MEGHEGERASTAEGTVSVFITAARIYRLNNDCVMESGPPSRPEINVVLVFVRAGNDRFFQEGQKKKWKNRFGECVASLVCPYGRRHSSLVERWRCGRMRGTFLR